jgi:thymidylate synthase (FAD)
MFPIVMEHIERCGRICYKSEDKITDDSAERFVKNICINRHESVLEHVALTAIVICSRSASHQLVRHRIAAYSQESMRYVNYGRVDALKVICPPSIGIDPGRYDMDGPERFLGEKQSRWVRHIESDYAEYKLELSEGVKAEDARYVLPNATKTEIAVTYNVRQWLHFLRTRCDSHAQWEIRGIALSILDDLNDRFPAIFGRLHTDVNNL